MGLTVWSEAIDCCYLFPLSPFAYVVSPPSPPQHPLTMVMLFSGDLYSLLNFLSFARWLFMGLAVAGLIYLRYKRPDMHRPFKVPLFIPALFSFTCLFMVVLSLYSDPFSTGVGFLITLTGVPAYYLFIVWDKKPKWFRRLSDRITRTLQIILEVVPEDSKELWT